MAARYKVDTAGGVGVFRTYSAAAAAALSDYPNGITDTVIFELSASTGLPHTDYIQVQGFGSTPACPVVVKTTDAHRAGPMWRDDIFRVVGPSYAAPLSVRNGDYAIFDGIQALGQTRGGKWDAAIGIGGIAGGVVKNCLIDCRVSSYKGYGINVGYSTNHVADVQIYNNILLMADAAEYGIYSNVDANCPHARRIYNNLVIGAKRGIRTGYLTPYHIKNNIVIGQSESCISTTAGPHEDYNIVSDTSARGANSVHNASIEFISPTNYTPVAGAVADGTGVDLPVATDMLGQPQIAGAYDIGPVLCATAPASSSLKARIGGKWVEGNLKRRESGQWVSRALKVRTGGKWQ